MHAYRADEIQQLSRLVHPVGYLEYPFRAAGRVDKDRCEYVRVTFDVMDKVIPLGHSTTASHALVQAFRSSVVVQAQISVQSPGLNCVMPISQSCVTGGP